MLMHRKTCLILTLYVGLGCLCFVSFPHDAMCWSEISDRVFSWSYSLVFFFLIILIRIFFFYNFQYS